MNGSGLLNSRLSRRVSQGGDEGDIKEGKMSIRWQQAITEWETVIKAMFGVAAIVAAVAMLVFAIKY